MFAKTFLLALIIIIAISATALAISLTTSVRFIIPVDLSFSISTPSNNTTFSTTSTAGLYFNSSSTTITMVNASLDPGQGTSNAYQNNGTAIFRYRNTGNVVMNITMQFNTITAACINVKASVGSTGWQSTCTNFTVAPTNLSCTNWNSTSAGAKNVTDSLAVNQVRDVWLWADFTSCAAGLDETDTITHTSNQ